MARHLTQIIQPLKQYLSARFAKQWRLAKTFDIADLSNLPAPLYIAQMRGEALLKLTFFECLEQKQIADPQSQQYAWQQLIQSNHCLNEIAEKSGLLAFFHINTEHADYKLQCFNAYCIVLWDAALNNNKLKDNLTFGLVNHYLPTLYPTKSKGKTPQQLQKEIAKLLGEQWQLKPEIKESFSTTAECVTFSLTAKLKGYSTYTLITLNGKRLNITKNKAYKVCLKQLQNEKTPLPNVLSSLKKQAPNPLV